jgi:hypothetical protein
MQIDSYSAEDIFELLVSNDWELVLNDVVENWKRSALEGFEAPGPELQVRSTIVLQLTKGLDSLKVVSRCLEGVETNEQVAATPRQGIMRIIIFVTCKNFSLQGV